MINIECIQAAQGDCIWVEYGKDQDSLHRILIDGGTSDTYKRLKKRIKKLKPNERHFDLLVITHIDADHIAGILKLFEKDGLGITFSDIWFNGYKHLGKSRIKGVVQGELLSDYLEQPHLNWNKAFKGKAVSVDKRKKFKSIKLPGGMKLTLFSPTQKALSDLKPHWFKEAKKAGLLVDNKLPYKKDLDTCPSRSKRLSRRMLPDIDALAKTSFEPDSSLTNGSSIAFLAEYAGKKMLFTGDAYATILLDSIQRYLPECEPLYLDLFKIPHHGSDGNISKKLLERIRCSTYLVSTNGAYHKHPDKIAIARIIKYGGHKPDLYFNYLSKYNEIWSNTALQEKYQYNAHYPTDEQTSIKISFKKMQQ
ncbi:MBL fold metallo-hydrolase [Sulfurovum sp.]|uniref:ComEC/Rec2 family competence protein n=1 Tax=Sulfurovum sp. TaxID=1969726 RepID=UPI0025EF247F|nr:MBL fold metallo-hydrolase [Sulfurovum sp.]